MKPTLVAYGNCQAAVLADVLKFSPELSEAYDVVYYQSFDHPVEGAAVIEPEVMARCEVLWIQHDEGRPFLYDGPLRDSLRKVTFPAVDLGVLWPFQTNDPLFTREPDYPYGMFPYGDRLLMQVAQSQLSGQSGRETFFELMKSSAFPFDRYLDIDLQRLMRREQGTTVKFAAFIMAHFRTDRLLWTYNHPTAFMFCTMLNRIIAATFPESRQADHPLHALGDRIFHHYDPFNSSYQAPVFPLVAQQLGLLWWSDDQEYYFHNDERLTVDQFVELYLAERIKRQL